MNDYKELQNSLSQLDSDSNLERLQENQEKITNSNNVKNVLARSFSVEVEDDLLKQKIILTNKDRLELVYYKHFTDVKHEASWQTPGSLFVTVLLVLITSDFKNFKIISGEALFGVALTLCVTFFIIFILKAIPCFFKIYKKKRNPRDAIDKFINEIERKY